MEQELTTSKIFKIIYGVFAMCLFCFTIYAAIINYKGNNSILLLPLIGTIGSALIMINLFKRKIILTDDSISYTSVWGSKELLVSKIKGYRKTKSAYYIYPINNTYSKISIYDDASIDIDNALSDWLHAHLKDVDLVAFENDKQAIFNNPAIGQDEKQREDKYENAVIYAIAYNIAGAVLFMLSFMLNIQHWVLTGILLLFPFLGIFLMFYTKGIVRFFAKLHSSAYRSLYAGIAICEVCLIAKANSNTTLLSHDGLFWPVVIVGTFFSIISLLVITKWASSVLLSQLFFIVLFAFGYGLGSVLVINYSFDISKEQIIPTTVKSRYTVQNKSTLYMLTLNDWGSYNKTEDIEVSSEFYNTINIGDSLKVHLKQGALHLPWFVISLH
jgi:hypothetical protein